LRDSDVTDLLGYQAKEIQHGYASGQHMHRRDEQGESNKEEGDDWIFLAFSAPSCKHGEGNPKPTEIG